MFPILNPPPSSLPTPSLWVVQCTSPKHAVSHIEPGLATRFLHDILHVSMSLSQIFPITRYLLTSYFCIPVPYKRKGHLFWVLVLEGLVHLHRTIQLQLLQHYWWGVDLDYCDIEWFALEMNRDHSVIFNVASNYPLTV